ncbi:hypothetical protein [Sphingobacterium siyangense]|uniref:hypothetical protein n=1 Tax=Sphingobacterium siyangense TaxID=459529 RepID=UPI003DA2CFD1
MIVKKFYKIYNSIVDRNSLLKKIRFYSLCRFIIRSIANLVLPIYFKYYAANEADKSCEMTIVSLTSFPKRINKVWLVIECLMRQDLRPARIILWLSKDQFSDIDALPQSIKSQIKRGLDVRLVEGDIRSHKKYYYAFNEYYDYNIITVDDDMYYPEDFIKTLIYSGLNKPGAVICCYARTLKRKEGVLLPYNTWDRAINGCNSVNELFFGSGGGTLFPSGALYKDSLKIDLFLRLTPLADDIWLNAMCRLNRTSIEYIQFITGYLPINIANNETLASKNLDEDLNNKQIENVNNYYQEQGKKVFV